MARRVLLEAELRLRMQLAPQRDHLVLDFADLARRGKGGALLFEAHDREPAVSRLGDDRAKSPLALVISIERSNDGNIGGVRLTYQRRSALRR